MNYRQTGFRLFWFCSAMALTGLMFTAAALAETQMQISVDVSDAPRHLLHVSEILPAHAGTNTFSYPKWIPGQHLPSGPVDNLTGLVFHANSPDGPLLAWRHDLTDPYSVHVVTPAALKSIFVRFDFLDVASRANTTTTRRTSSHVVMVEPSDIVLYPAGIPMQQISVRAEMRLPPNWTGASALRTPNQTGPSLFGTNPHFAPVSLEQFVDSPIVAGDHCQQFPLAKDIKPQHTLDVCAESASALNVAPALLDDMSALVLEATQLFHSHHYEHYDFLVALSPHLDGDSLEHTQSAGYVVKSSDPKESLNVSQASYLIAHEYTHAWCGKYRRPARMVTPDFQTPQQDDLLWVYEGLTEYYGDVLATRAGFRTPTETLGLLDYAVYTVDQPGRRWRSLQDTADVAPILRNPTPAWTNWRRDQDYYREGALLWLEADMKIRTLTAGRKALDDFAALFFGANAAGGTGDTGPGVLAYEFADVVRSLNAVAPYDWASFWTERLSSLAPAPPTVGLQDAGYTYVESDVMSDSEASYIMPGHMSDMLHSLGIFVLADGTLRDVWMHSPAYVAGLGPGDRLTAVNGDAYSADVLAKAVRDAKLSGRPVVLTALRDDEKQTFQIDYRGGEKYSILTRNQKPDTLTTGILVPKYARHERHN